MLERATTLSATAEGPLTTILARRRALFAVLVAGTMAAMLWLATVAVPPFSAATDCTIKRPDPNLARLGFGQRLFADFGMTGADIPKRFGG